MSATGLGLWGGQPPNSTEPMAAPGPLAMARFLIFPDRPAGFLFLFSDRGQASEANNYGVGPFFFLELGGCLFCFGQIPKIADTNRIPQAL